MRRGGIYVTRLHVIVCVVAFELMSEEGLEDPVGEDHQCPASAAALVYQEYRESVNQSVDPSVKNVLPVSEYSTPLCQQRKPISGKHSVLNSRAAQFSTKTISREERIRKAATSVFI